MDVIKTFGQAVTHTVAKRPAAARHMMSVALKGYGAVNRLTGRKAELPARNYMMQATNHITANSLTGHSTSAIVSIFTPCEMLHAMGITPIFPEGLGAYTAATCCEKGFAEEAEACGIPETLCSYHKVLIGQARQGMLPRPDFILNTTLACDANQLTFRWLAEFYGVPRFVLDVPQTYTQQNLRYLTAQLQDMADFLETQTGRKLQPQAFRDAVSRAEQTLKNYRRILEIKATRNEGTKMTSYMVDAYALHVLLGTPASVRYTADLAAQLAKLPQISDLHAPGKPLRLLWLHTIPYWQTALCDVLNQPSRVEIVGCDMALDCLSALDATRPYETLAAQLLQNTFNGPAKRRIDNALYWAKALHADGILYFCHWGCKQTLGASAIAKAAFEEAGFPTLTLDGDGCDRRNNQDGQMVTRIEAFLEQLEGARH